MVRVAHLADTHLGLRQYDVLEREQDFYEVLDEVAERILEERVDLVLHSGDVFDVPAPPAQAYRAFRRFLDRLGDKTKVFAVLGDHDTPRRVGDEHPLVLFEDRVRVLGVNGRGENHVVNAGGQEVLVAGVSNLKLRYRAVLLDELTKLGQAASKHKLSILMLHQGLKEFLPFEGAHELEMAELPRGFTYYAMGHIHTRAKVEFGGGILAYAGSMEIVRADEVEGWEKYGKGLYIVDLP